jgi:hypothetical protein
MMQQATSLMTPLVRHVSHSGPWLELLLASKAEIKPAHVNRQLKICAGLDADKLYHPNWLFPAPGDKILVEAAPKEGEIVRTHELFEGVLHALFEKRMKKAGLTKLFRVRVAAEALPTNFEQEVFPVRPEPEKNNLAWRAERQDYLVRDMLKERHKLAGHPSLPDDGCFAFEVSSYTGPQTKVDRSEPIQTYHPVYVHQASEPVYLNFGHLTDIHLNARLNLLQRSPARVLNGGEPSNAIGSLLQPTNAAFANLLGQMADEKSVHALAIGGDLIDHHLNACQRSGAKRPSTTKEIWDAVDLNRPENYVPCVDIVGFYSLLRSFMKRCQKPIFGIAGNHDAYLDAFGISPRALHKRANAGIPADLNLTLYEAVLAFGPSYADFNLHVNPPSSFDAEWMEWFYTVFTPFADASVQLPRQRVVCLGWGGSEDMVGGGQELAHLPRADDSVSDVQLKLLRSASAKSAKFPVVVLSHFTVASFEEKVPMLVMRGPAALHTQGFIATQGETENKYNMGTYENNRAAFMTLLSERKLACILSGHSHRRGLYVLDGPVGGGQYGLTFRDPELLDLTKLPASKLAPAIIVSDSGGPYPRHNYAGELGGWGSDMPAGSILNFDAAGHLRRVEVVRAKGTTRPRLSVAADYLDIEREEFWDAPLRTAPFSPSAEAAWLRGGCKAPFYELQMPCKKGQTHGVLARSVAFYAPVRGGQQSLRVKAVLDDDGYAALDAAASKAFYSWFRDAGTGGEAFLKVALEVTKEPKVNARVSARWDNDPWYIEVTTQLCLTVTPLGWMQYRFDRPVRYSGQFSFRDLPDFDKRDRERGQ